MLLRAAGFDVYRLFSINLDLRTNIFLMRERLLSFTVSETDHWILANSTQNLVSDTYFWFSQYLLLHKTSLTEFLHQMSSGDLFFLRLMASLLVASLFKFSPGIF